jgi:hypothetical protein
MISAYPNIPSNQSTLAAPWELQVARGKVSGVSQLNMFAFNSAVGTSFIPVWENATAYTYPASALTMTLASTSASDNATARVVISGLTTAYVLATETVALNGITGVNTVNTYLRINSMVMTVPGSGQTTNVGVITAKNGATTYAQINAGIGKTQMSIFSVPAGFTMYALNINAFQGDSASGYVNYRIQSRIDTGPQLTVLQTSFRQSYQVPRSNPFPYPEKSDVQWQFSVNTGAHALGFILEGLLISNTAS